MKELIRLLKIAHAVETGAIEAYDGHWRSLPKDSEQRLDVYVIMHDEIEHQAFCAKILDYTNNKPNKYLDLFVKMIGKMIGKMCHYSPRKASALGAAIMEVIGSNIYQRLAEVALDLEMNNLASQFLIMAKTETDHEIYFKNGLVPSKESGPRNQS